MENLGLWLVGAAFLLSPVATWVLWRSMRAGQPDETRVSPEEASRRLSVGLETADTAVQERYARKDATPAPTFARGRGRVTIERPTEPQSRRYM